MALHRLRPTRAAALRCGGAALALALAGPALADETCQSPYMAKITGEEDFVYVWTLGVEGLGDGSDKLVTVDVRKDSPTFGKPIHAAPVGGRHEAHHGGFTDDRRQFWAAGLSDSRIFIFDVATDPARPRLVRTIDDFVAKSGGVAGPHGAYALPGRMLIPGLSNKDGTGRTALVEYSNEGDYITTHWLPTDAAPGGARVEAVADGYGYDARVLPRRNVMLTSSFTGIENYMRPLGEVVRNPEAMKRFGQTMVLWDFHARQPRTVLHVPGAPLEIRWAWGPYHSYAFTSTALTSKIWLVREDEGGAWKAEAVADIGDPATLPVPVDISLSADDTTLFVDTFTDGTTRVFDVSDPRKPRQIYEKKIGAQLNMVSQSWDGKRIYYTSSLLANWDKTGPDNEQFLKAYTWDRKELTPRFSIDFTAEKLGRPHMMAFGAAALYTN
ncbi:selenium-binding protein SBP56-related protein [Methylobacterium nodulans]|uniref:Selenium-binding protein, putative n=1 Tax=Methylobacterium nodulans (strain LMG 21967 / CNCM I-2342 / ORS 2060) TaxID=460265 RepID=B8IKM1_METNO|nr:selenium-binding protein SBP56-related protein [Methylobacterium nodulans]ACL56228.1 selenium-binding protein, putative [Methylobacterium nodulans ORS 2060]